MRPQDEKMCLIEKERNEREREKESEEEREATAESILARLC